MNTFRTKPDDTSQPVPPMSHRLLSAATIVAKWAIWGGLVVFGCITAVGTFGLDPFWSSLIGLALAFGIIVWHMPRKPR